MSLFAISDLHLPCDDSKKMDVFGDNWKDHFDKIKDNWYKVVKPDDIVLLPGDLSWAMSLDDALPHLKMISDLPGRKVILRGNHDYWWTSLTKVRNAVTNGTYVIQNDSICLGDYVICGTRGWIMPGDPSFDEDKDRQIYDRELIRLQLTLDSAGKDLKEGRKLIVMMHFPPAYPNGKDTGFTKLISDSGASAVVYGHLHGKQYSIDKYPVLLLSDIPYYLVSCDANDFKLKKLY